MHARVSHYTCPVDRMDDLVRAFEEPDIESAPGFVTAYLLIERDQGKAITITLWETEQALLDTGADAEAVREKAARDFGGTVDSVMHYEVGLGPLLPPRVRESGGEAFPEERL